MSTSKNPVSSAILQLAGVEKLPNTGILLSPEAIQLIEKSSAQIQSSTGGEESPGIPSGQPGAQDEGKDASLAKGLFGIVSTVTFGPSALTAITKGKFNPLSALVESFEAFGKPRDPNETLGERYGSLIEESKRSDPNRDVAYGALGTKNSYSLPGTSFTLGISDEDVLGLTKEEAEKNLNVTEFQSTNTQAQRDQAEEDASTVGVGTAAAAAAARGTPPSTDFGFGEMGSTSGSRSDSPTGGIEGDTSGNPGGAGVGAGDESSSAPGHGSPGAWNTGGKIGALIQHLQTGGDVENAETDLGNANIAMGVVDDPDGAPGPFSGGTGVEDDLDMDVEAGSYVLNAEAVQLIGISDINAVIRDAYSIAAALGKPMPQDYDPQNKVPIRISNGEAVIPKALVDIIGLDKLEKWNQKGLQLRKQKEEFMAQQQQAQPPQGPQVAAEAPMQQQMGQLMNQGGKTEYGQLQVGEISQGINLDAFTNSENTEQLQRLLSGEVESSDEKLIPKNITQPEIEYILRKHYGAKLPKGFREAVNNQRVPRNLGELAKVITNAEWRNSNELEKGHTFRFTGYDKANAKGEFSSAFGPGQVTATRAKDILKLIPDTDQNFKTYVKEYIEQGNKRISLLQNRNAKRKEQRIPLKKPDKTLFAKGIGNIPLEKHEKYYNRLFNLHLEDHLNTYRK